MTRLICVLLLTGCASVPAVPRYPLSVWVTDTAGRPIDEAVVALESRQWGIRVATVRSVNGSAHFGDWPRSEITLCAFAPGYERPCQDVAHQDGRIKALVLTEEQP